MTPYIKSLIYEGIERNIIVFDSDSKDYSKRLELLMNDVAKLNFKENVIEFIREEDYPGMTTYYTNLGGTLAKDKTNLVVGVTYTSSILGSY